MTNPNWGLLGGGNNALNFFQMGSQIGQQVRERQDEKEKRNALATYATNPTPETLAPVIQADPRLGMQLQGQRAQQARQAQEQKRADLPLLSRLVETSTDEASYQRNRMVAQEYGIDTSNLPPQFDPAWRDQQLMTLKALQDPTKAEALSTAGKQAVDMGYRPGTAEFNKAVQDIWTAGEAKPYVVGGETRLYSPKIGGQGQAVGGPAPGTVEDGYRFIGGNPADRSSWEPVAQGGQTARPSGTFRGSFSGLPGETVTSTYRSPSHNAKVGGVSNSFHTRRTADGKPMARDSVPPRGMSMAAYAAELRRRNPDMDVINEGDHVHLEPKG